jgi:hypothetical protein
MRLTQMQDTPGLCANSRRERDVLKEEEATSAFSEDS